jgi:hypothetical protein
LIAEEFKFMNSIRRRCMMSTARACLLVLLTFGPTLLWVRSDLVVAADEPAPSESPTVASGRSGTPADGPGGLEPNCRAEIKQLCGGIEPGGGQIRKCLKDNESKFSAGCREQIKAKKSRMKERRHEMRATCEADVKRLCPNVQPGDGRIMMCLREYKSELSEGCASTLGKGKPRK